MTASIETEALAQNPFEAGDRVRLNLAGRLILPRAHEQWRVGLVFGRPRQAERVGVLWPGCTSPQYLHVTYLEKAPPAAPQAEPWPIGAGEPEPDPVPRPCSRCGDLNELGVVLRHNAHCAASGERSYGLAPRRSEVVDNLGPRWSSTGHGLRAVGNRTGIHNL